MSAVDEVAAEAAVRLERAVSALTRLASRARMRQALLSAGSALSPTDMWLVRRLCEEGPARMSDLARWQVVDRSTMTMQVRRLEHAGLVVRGTDPTDRRAVLVSVSPRGRKTYEENRTAATALFADLVGPWSEYEREELTTSLGRLVAALEERLTLEANAADGHGR